MVAASTDRGSQLTTVGRPSSLSWILAVRRIPGGGGGKNDSYNRGLKGPSGQQDGLARIENLSKKNLLLLKEKMVGKGLNRVKRGMEAYVWSLEAPPPA